MRNHCKVEQAERIEQAGVGARVWSQWRHHPESLGQSGECIATNHLLQEPIETFVESENANDFKGFEALYNIVLDIDNQLLYSDVQMEVVKHMYD
jgi:hypothetical protein